MLSGEKQRLAGICAPILYLISGSSHKKFLNVMRKIFAVTALFASSQLGAQTLPDTTRIMDEVTLTASKFSVKTTETGKVVTLITRQDIEHAGSRDLAQLITELGGVYINGYNGTPGKEKNVYLRGANVAYTLITIDGVPVYDASGIGSNFDIRNMSIDNVERIEILKGSQSTLYGSDAIAGVINIVTRKGAAKPFAFSGVADWGSYDTRRLDANVSGSLKLFDYNVGYAHFGTDGFSEAKRPANVTTAYDKDGYRQNSVQASLSFHPAAGIRIAPFLRYTRFKGDLDQDAFVDELDFTNTNKNLQAGVQNVFKLGSGQLHVQYQFTHTDRRYLDDSTESRNGYYIYNRQNYIAREHFAEAFAVYPLGAVKLTAGADLRSSNTGYDALQSDPYSGGPYATSFSGDSVKQHQVGVYAALNYGHNGFFVEGGGRFNHHSSYGSNFAFNFNPSYLVAKHLKIFANLSSGYRTPSLYQLFSIYGNRELQPETSLNLEGGVQVFTADEHAGLRAVYFNRHIKDVIAFFTDPVTFASRYINQDKQKDHGIELEGNVHIGNKLQVKALYTYVTGDITTKQHGKDTTYFNLLRRPKSTLNLSAGAQLTSAFYFSAQLSAIGKRSDVYFDPVTFASVPITLKKYFLLNVYAEYGLLKGKLKLFADVRNLLDADYSDIYGYNTAGFNAYGGIRIKL